MAIKFSQFVVKTSSSDLSHIVGYNGVDNIQITPTNFLNTALTGTAGQVLFYDTTGVTGDNDLYWDNTNKRLGIGTSSPGEPLEVHGNIKARFPANGALGQIKLGNLSNLLADNGDLQIRNNLTGLVKVTSVGNVGIGTMSPSEKLEVVGNIKVGDSQKFIAGDGNDFTIQHNGTVSAINNAVGNIQIYQNANDGDIQFFSDDGSGGVTEYFRLDGGNASGGVVNTLFPDNSKVVVGNDSDARFWHNGTNSFIQNITGDLEIQNYANDSDIVFQSDDGSGGIAEYFRVDGGSEEIIFSKDSDHLDNVSAYFGTDKDLRIHHNGSHTFISNNQGGDLRIIQNVDDGDIKFQADDGSGGTATYFEVQGTNTRTVFRKTLNLQDSVDLYLGTSSDLRLVHNSSDSVISNATGNLTITNSADDKDIQFKCDDGSGGTTEYFRVDGGTERIESSKSFRFADGARAQFGASSDMQIYHDSNDSRIENSTGDIVIQNETDDRDIKFRCDDGSGGTTEYFRLDGSSTYNIFSKDLYIPDDVILRIGTGQDLRILHETGSTSKIENYTGNLTIQQRADDSDIVFQCDDGSGGLTEYFRVDGSSVQTIVTKNFRYVDNAKILIGTGEDLQIYHDGSNSYIEDTGTGDLKIKGSNDIFLLDGSNNVMIEASAAGSVDLYHNNNKKLETTSTGIKVTGVSEYADNTAAIAAGLTTGDVYRTGDLLKIVH